MTEINDILNQFSKLSVENSEENSSISSVLGDHLESKTDIMVPPVQERPRTINWDLFKSKVANIKPYDGESNTLNKFISRCESLIATYSEYNDNELGNHIFECIQEKLIGKAEIMVGNRLELNNWNLLKDALKQCFSDRRNLDCLTQELTRTRPYKNENLIDFGTRLQLLRSSVAQRISNDNDLNAQEKLYQINHSDKIALNTFIAGCTGVLKNNMHLKQPASLEDAMGYVTEYENFEKLYGNHNEPRNNFPKNNFRSNNFNFRPNNDFQSKPKFNSQFNMQNNQYQSVNQPQQGQYQNIRQPVWSSQPINIQPRPMPQRNYPTNAQVFGNQQNVFKPKQTPQNQLPKPEPMSTTSRIPSMYSRRTFNSNNRFNRNNNYSQNNSNQRPNFIAEELFVNNYEEHNEESQNFDYNPYQNQNEIANNQSDEDLQNPNFQITASNENPT